MLSYRQRRILFAVVSEHITSGEPVASGTLVRKQALALSPASVRAVLGELEVAGFVFKSHASAGRVPTTAGIRVFVHALLSSTEVSEAQRIAVEQALDAAEPGHDSTLRAAGKALAAITGSASVVVQRQAERASLRELRFVQVRERDILAVLVATDGSVQNRMIRADAVPTHGDLERANNLLASLLEGRSLQEVRTAIAGQLADERARFDLRHRAALMLGEQALAPRDETEVLVEGQARLIERPEFDDIGRAREALRALGDHELLVRLLDHTLSAPGVQVVFGEDAGGDTGELSLVAAGVGRGSIAVVGSHRMDFQNVVPVVRYTAARVSRILNAQRSHRIG